MITNVARLKMSLVLTLQQLSIKNIVIAARERDKILVNFQSIARMLFAFSTLV